MAVEKTMLEWARFYADEWGACVIPLREGKMPAVRWSEFQRRRPTGEELERWFGGDNPAWGMALVCGEVSGNLVRLDFDDPKDYAALSPFLLGRSAFKSQRKGGGYGVLMKSFELTPKMPGGTFENYPKLEIMGEGCITAVPPTPGYEWVGDVHPPQGTNLKSWLLNALNYDGSRVDRALGGAAQGGRPDDELDRLLTETEEGGRDDALVRLTNILRSRGLRLHAIRAVIRPHFDEWPWTDKEMTWDEASAKVEATYYRYEHEGTRYASAEEEEFEEDAGAVFGPRRAEDTSYLVDKLILPGDQANVVMAAFSGIGKTTLCLEIAVCMSQGRDVLDTFKVDRPLKVLYIDEEGVASQIRETSEKIAEVYGRPSDPGMLTLVGGKHGSYKITSKKSLDKLEARIARLLPDFVFLDGWQWFVDNKISDRDFVGPALAWWKRVRLTYHCGTWIIHHTKKTGAPQFRPANILEMSSGAQVLMDQARTKLIFEHLEGQGEFYDYSYMQGVCGRGSWNPIRVVLEYDSGTQSHRVIGQEEAAEVFDAERIVEIWGEKQETREVRTLLNLLRRRGWNSSRVAEFLGVNRSSVSRWRSGAMQPSQDKVEALRKVRDEMSREGQETSKQHSSNFSEKTAPLNSERLPKAPVPAYIYKKNKKGGTCPVANEDSLSSGTPFSADAKNGKPKDKASVTFEEL